MAEQSGPATTSRRAISLALDIKRAAGNIARVLEICPEPAEPALASVEHWLDVIAYQTSDLRWLYAELRRNAAVKS